MILTLDFETYYDREFSLSKMTTEEYVRDDRFEVIGVGVKVDDAETEWFSGSFDETKQFLSKFKWEEAFVLAHNTMFDGAILSWRFGIKPKMWLDTLCMARATDGLEVGNSLAKLALRYNVGVKGQEVLNALGKRRIDFTSSDLAKYGAYCCNDVDLCYTLFGIMAPRFGKGEIQLIDLTLRMFTEPVLTLDLPLLEQHLEEVKEKKERLLAAANSDRDTLLSNDKFAALLQSIGVVVPTKVSPATGKETWALAKSDEGLKALQDHDDLRVQALVAARLGTKSTLEETRTARFIGIAKRGVMPVPLRYYAAHTGRWGGDDKLNLQNLPRKSLLKEAIEPPKGFVLINSDSSQIEARTVAWLAGQKDLTDAFDKGEDVYKIMASAIYRKPVEEVTKDERFVGKTTILGAGYGMGALKFQAQLKTFGVSLPEEECQRIIAVYRETYPHIPKLWKEAQKSLEAFIQGRSASIGTQPQALYVDATGDGGVGFRLPSGLFLRYPGLERNSDGEFSYATRAGHTKIYGGKVVENFTQAIARCAVGEQMLKISKKYKVALTVHDSVVCVAPKEEINEAVAYVEECMKWRPTWAQTLPLSCEVGYGKNYGEA
jgi:DNA polymerase